MIFPPKTIVCNLLDGTYVTLYNARKDAYLHLALLCTEEKVNLMSKTISVNLHIHHPYHAYHHAHDRSPQGAP